MNFPDTRWTLIACLGDEAKAGAALDQLCGMYWQPIHAYLIHLGHGHAQAQDLTQEFLKTAVRQRLLEHADPGAGRLRSWIVTALQHFLANARRDSSAQKRGAGTPALPLDQADASPDLLCLASSGLSPDEAFDRAWAALLLRRALDQLARQYQSVAKEAEFQALLPSLLEEGGHSQIEAAAQAGMTLTKFRVQLHRLRGRYRELLREEIVATLAREEDFEEELAYLCRLLGQPV